MLPLLASKATWHHECRRWAGSSTDPACLSVDILNSGALALQADVARKAKAHEAVPVALDFVEHPRMAFQSLCRAHESPSPGARKAQRKVQSAGVLCTKHAADMGL